MGKQRLNEEIENEEELDETMTPGGHTDKKQDAPKYSGKSDSKKMKDDDNMLPEEDEEDMDDDDEEEMDDEEEKEMDDDDEEEKEMDEASRNPLFQPYNDRYYVVKKEGGKTKYHSVDMKKGPYWTDNHNFAYTYKNKDEAERVASEVGGEVQKGVKESSDLMNDLQTRLSEMSEDELQELSNVINDPIESSVASISRKVNTIVSANEETEEEPENNLSSLIESDETLSEDFKSKAATIFEAAVSEKVEKEVESIREQYNERTREAISEQFDTLVEKVDNYLTYAVETWIEENDENITNKLRTQISESFIESLKNVFEKHYIEMPEGKVDVYEDITEKARELEETAEQQAEQLENLNETVEQLQREKVIREQSEDLYDTEAERLQKLVKNLEFESVDNFKEKVSIIRETYFGSDNGKTEKNDNDREKRLSEQTYTRTTHHVEEDESIDENSEMGQYIKALSQHVKNQT